MDDLLDEENNALWDVMVGEQGQELMRELQKKAEAQDWTPESEKPVPGIDYVVEPEPEPEPKPDPKPDPKPVAGSQYMKFREAVGFRESSNNYKAKNQYGYLGKYQFGLARLCDLGLCIRKPGTRGYSNNQFKWGFGFNENMFLNNPTLQNEVFDVHIRKHRARVLSAYKSHLNKTINGVKVTLSGAIGCFHLLGEGGFRNFISGKDTADANGTKASHYIKLFQGYTITENDLSQRRTFKDYLYAQALN